MTQPITQDDLIQIAAELTTHYGLVPVNALATVGVSDTVIVRPGTATVDGRVLTGRACAAALGDDFEVFPMAVEYAVDDLDDALGAMDAALDDLDDALGQDDDAPAFGLFKRDLAKRYMKVVGRYRKVMTKLEAKPTKSRQRRADRRFRRMIKLWQKMERKGIDTSGLPSPPRVRAEFVQRAAPRAAAPPSMPLPSAFEPEGPSEGPDPGYFRDQQELEREMQAIMPSFGATEEVHDFLGALDDLDVALGDLEEAIDGGDQFGLFKRDLPKRYMKVVARYRKVMSKIEAKSTKARERKAARRLRRLEKLWSKMEQKGIDRAGLPSPDAVRAEYEEDREESLTSPVASSSSMPSYLVPRYAATQEAFKSDLRCQGGGFGLSMMEHDYFGLRSSDVEVLFADTDLGAGDDLDDAELAADVDDSEDEVLLGVDRDEVGFLRFPGSRHRRLKRWSRRGVILTPRRARRVARWRARWQRKLARVRSPRRRERIRARIALADQLLQQSAVTFGANDGEGVDYARLKPKTPGTPGEPVIVIAIKKRPTTASLRAKAVAGYSRNVFGAVPAQPGLIDVLAADLAELSERSFLVNTGYTAPEAMLALMDWTHPSNWIYGEDGDRPYPLGGASPLPPPRRSGPEVLG